jgi:hypothetical protein
MIIAPCMRRPDQIDHDHFAALRRYIVAKKGDLANRIKRT